MVFINEAMTWQTKPLSVIKIFYNCSRRFAPHLAEELWARLHSTFWSDRLIAGLCALAEVRCRVAHESEIEIPVQVNGKLRDVIKVSVNATAAELEALALANDKAKRITRARPIKKSSSCPKKVGEHRGDVRWSTAVESPSEIIPRGFGLRQRGCRSPRR